MILLRKYKSGVFWLIFVSLWIIGCDPRCNDEDEDEIIKENENNENNEEDGTKKEEKIRKENEERIKREEEEERIKREEEEEDGTKENENNEKNEEDGTKEKENNIENNYNENNNSIINNHSEIHNEDINDDIKSQGTWTIFKIIITPSENVQNIDNLKIEDIVSKEYINNDDNEPKALLLNEKQAQKIGINNNENDKNDNKDNNENTYYVLVNDITSKKNEQNQYVPLFRALEKTAIDKDFTYSIEIIDANTTEVTNMSHMFDRCTKLKSLTNISLISTIFTCGLSLSISRILHSSIPAVLGDKIFIATFSFFLSS